MNSVTTYWVYDVDGESKTQIHDGEGASVLEAVPCYKGGPQERWHGPFRLLSQAEEQARSVGRNKECKCKPCFG